MDGVKDSVGCEIELGDPVKVLREVWPEDHYQCRIGTVGKVAELLPGLTYNEPLALVVFEDEEEIWYAPDKLEVQAR